MLRACGASTARRRRRRTVLLAMAALIASLLGAPAAPAQETRPEARRPPGSARGAPNPEALRLSGSVVLDAGAANRSLESELTVELRRYPTAVERRLWELGRGELPPVVSRTPVVAGRFELSAPQPGMWRLQVNDAQQRHAPVAVDLLPLVDHLVLPPLRLDPGVEVRARIVDPAGQPLPGALVLFDSVDLAASREFWVDPRYPPRTPRQVRRTDAQGFAIARLPRGARWVRASHPRFLMSETNEPDTDLGLQLHDAVPTTLLLRTARGEPAAGAIVRMGQFSVPIAVADTSGKAEVLAHEQATISYQVETRAREFASVQLAPRPQNVSDAEKGAGAASDVVPVRLEPPRLVRGGLVERGSGQAVPGAMVFSTWHPGEAVRSDSRGAFVLPLLDFRDEVTLEVAHPAYQPLRHSLAGQAPRPGAAALVLERAATLAGRVEDVSGTAITDARLVLQPEGRGSRQRRVTGTHVDGSFHFPGLVPGQLVEIIATAPGFAASDLTVRASAEHSTAASAQEHTLVLQRGFLLTGRVVSTQEEPVPGAAVRFYQADSDLARRARLDPQGASRFSTLAAETEADGTFVVENAPPGLYALSVTHPDYLAAQIPGIAVHADIALPPPQERGAVPEPPALPTIEVGTVALSRGVTISGLVTDDRGGVIEGAALFVEPDDGSPARVRGRPDEEPDAVTDAAGRFSIAQQPTDKRLRLEARASGRAPGMLSGVQAPAQDLLLELAPGADLVGTVRRRTEEGLLEALPNGIVNLRREAVIYGVGRSARTGEEGAFAIQGLAPGTYELTANAVDALRFEREIELVAGEPHEVEVVLERGRTVSGRMLDRDGLGVVGVQVRAAADAAGYGIVSFAQPSAADGAYSLQVPAGESLVLTAQHAEYRPSRQELPAGEADVVRDFQLERGLAIRGVLLSRDRLPVPGARVAALPTDGDLLGNGTSRSDHAGRFEIAGLGPGRYELSAWHPDHGRAQSEQPLELVATPLSDIELRFDAQVRISGTILGLGVDELAATTVRTSSLSAGRSGLEEGVAPDYEGRFVLHLPPGNHGVYASDGSGRTAHAQLLLTAEQSEASVELDFGGTHEITVIASNREEPLAGAMVMITSPSSGTNTQATTDSNGRAVLTGVPSGKVTLMLLWAAGQHATRELEIADDQEVLLELDRESYLGRVVDRTTGAGIPEVTLSVLQGTGSALRSLGSSRTARDGSFELQVDASGPVTIAAQAEGFVPYRGTHELAIEGELLLALDPASGVRLQVTPSFTTLHTLPRVLARAGQQAVQEMVQPRPGAAPGSSLLELTQLGAGSWRVLLVSPDGHARFDLRLPLAEAGSTVPVVLQPNGALEFTLGSVASAGDAARIAVVVEAGWPLEQAMPLGLADLSSVASPGEGLGSMMGGRLPSGAYRMPGLPAGNLLLQIHGADEQRLLLEVPFSVAPSTTTQLTLP